ncbi:MAG: hypothetical protein ACI4J1_04995 [Ruminiclostridium sp.]
MTEIIKKQTEILLQNVRNALLTADLTQKADGVQNGRYLYHTIHSLDKWFINPYDYTEPRGFPKDFDKLDKEFDFTVSKEQLSDYFDRVSAKITDYLSEITAEMLTEKPPDCKYTRLELILGQFRHAMCHVGIVMGMAMAEGKSCPQYVGLDGVYK